MGLWNGIDYGIYLKSFSSNGTLLLTPPPPPFKKILTIISNRYTQQVSRWEYYSNEDFLWGGGRHGSILYIDILHKLSPSKIKSRDHWVSGANWTSVLCRPCSQNQIFLTEHEQHKKQCCPCLSLWSGFFCIPFRLEMPKLLQNFKTGTNFWDNGTNSTSKKRTSNSFELNGFLVLSKHSVYLCFHYWWR